MNAEINSNNSDKWWIAAIIVTALLFLFSAFWAPARAQKLDTIPIDPTCIGKVIQKQTPKSVRYYAVYNDGEISDIISISKTVVEYWQTCKQNGISPALGIKFKDGQIQSIIKYRKRYETRTIRKR